jgi:ABC-type uncharacterized transport system permease subunit
LAVSGTLFSLVVSLPTHIFGQIYRHHAVSPTCRRHVADILCLGGGWVGAGVMVGVVAAIWQRGRVEGAAPGKKREKNYHNTV